jgi:hypothetical protein
MVFSVAMTSKRNALLALLIASNFVEIKVHLRPDRSRMQAACYRWGPCLVRVLTAAAGLSVENTHAPFRQPAARHLLHTHNAQALHILWRQAARTWYVLLAVMPVHLAQRQSF